MADSITNPTPETLVARLTRIQDFRSLWVTCVHEKAQTKNSVWANPIHNDVVDVFDGYWAVITRLIVRQQTGDRSQGVEFILRVKRLSERSRVLRSKLHESCPPEELAERPAEKCEQLGHALDRYLNDAALFFEATATAEENAA